MRQLQTHLYILSFLLIASTVIGQSMVTGTVYDHEHNPMPGVNVVESGYENRVATDAQGKFSISCHDKTPILIFQFIGYLTETISIDPLQPVSIQMKFDDAALQGSFSCCWCVFYDRYSAVGVTSGLLHTPYGLKIDNLIPHTFGIWPLIAVGGEWRTGNHKNNRYFAAYIRRYDIRLANEVRAALLGEMKNFKLGMARTIEYAAIPEILARGFGFSTGYVFQEMNNEYSKTSAHGVIVGVQVNKVRSLSIDLKAKYIFDGFQYDFKLNYRFERPQITALLKYEKFATVSEITTALLYRIRY